MTMETMVGAMKGLEKLNNKFGSVVSNLCKVVIHSISCSEQESLERCQVSVAMKGFGTRQTPRRTSSRAQTY